MRNLVVFASTLLLLILMVNANEKVQSKTDGITNNEELKNHAKTLIRGESESSSKPKAGVLQKPILLKEATKSQTEENAMKHLKLLPESKTVSKYDSPRHKNDSTLAPDNTLLSTALPSTTSSMKNSTNLRASDVPPTTTVSNKNTEKASLKVPANTNSLNNHAAVPESQLENSTEIIEEITIVPIDVDVTDLVTSMLLGNTVPAETEAYTEDIVEIIVTEGDNIDGLDAVTNQPEPETSTPSLANPNIDESLVEAITELEKVALELTTLSESNSTWPISIFEFFVLDDNTSVPCILMTMDITLSVTYETKDHKSKTAEYQLPDQLSVTGHCGDRDSSMTILWTKTSIITKQNSITFNFVNDNSSFYVDSMNIDLALDPRDFPDAKDTFVSGNSSTNLKLFSASVENGINVCSTETKVSCGKIVANINNVTLIAYNKNLELSSRKEEHCHIASSIIDEVNVGGIIGGIIAVIIVLALIGTLCSWYRRRTDITFRSELP